MCRTAPVGSHAITCRFGYPLGRTAGCARDVGPNRYHVETFGRGPVARVFKPGMGSPAYASNK